MGIRQNEKIIKQKSRKIRKNKNKKEIPRSVRVQCVLYTMCPVGAVLFAAPEPGSRPVGMALGTMCPDSDRSLKQTAFISSNNPVGASPPGVNLKQTLSPLRHRSAKVPAPYPYPRLNHFPSSSSFIISLFPCPHLQSTCCSVLLLC